MKLINKYRNSPIQIRASFWFLISSFLQRGISVITTPIFTRILSTSEYGNYSVFNSWLGIATIIVTLNLYCGVYMTGLVKFSERKAAYSSALQGLTLTLCTVWTIIYLVGHNFWNNLLNLTTVQMLSMLVLIWTSTSFAFWSTYQRVEYKYRAMIIVTLLVSLAKPLLGIALVVNAEDKVTARILGLVIVELIGYTWTFFYQMFKGKVFFSKEIWKYALAFNIPLIPHYLAAVVLNSSDRIMIESMVGSSEAGIYSLAYSVSMIMTLFNSATQQTLLPWIYQKIKEGRQTDIHKIVYPIMVFIGCLNIALIMLAPEVVKIFAPPSYYDAIYVIPPVAMSVFFMFIYDTFVPFEFYFEKTKFIAVSSMGAALLNIGLNYIFINIYGYIAAGYTTFVCYVLNALFHFIFMTKVCKDKFGNQNVYSFKVILLVAFGFVSAGFILLTLYNYPVIRYSLVAVVLIGIFLKRKMIIKFIKRVMNLKKMSE